MIPKKVHQFRAMPQNIFFFQPTALQSFVVAIRSKKLQRFQGLKTKASAISDLRVWEVLKQERGNSTCILHSWDKTGHTRVL